MNPLSHAEMAEHMRALALADNCAKGVFFHGGRGGMAKGQFILPPAVTGAKSQRAFGNHLTDQQRVYVTTDVAAALLYAVSVADGEVYQVEPDGELEPDPDCSEQNLSFACPRARIVRVVRVTRAERAMALRALIDQMGLEVRR